MAKACGRLDDVDGMLSELSAAQYRELLAFERLEGVDDSANWQKLFAVLARGFFHVANRCGLGGEPIPVSEFLPPETVKVVDRRKSSSGAKPVRAGETASVAEQKALLRTIVATHNARA